MIYFGIPLRSKAASNDWENVTRVFNRTLSSVYNQTNPEFKIIVACHDVPELYQKYDKRVEFLVADCPLPTTPAEMMWDKGWKVSMIAKRVRDYAGGYTMLIDSDDIISNRVAEYVNEHPGRNGFLSRYGYIYNDGFPYMKKMLALHRICGSCSIVNYSKEELPDTMPNSFYDESFKQKYIISKSHRDIPNYLESVGRKLEEMPFPTTIYVRNTGDNHSMFGGIDLNWKRKAELMLRHKIRLDGSVGQEFGFCGAGANNS